MQCVKIPEVVLFPRRLRIENTRTVCSDLQADSSPELQYREFFSVSWHVFNNIYQYLLQYRNNVEVLHA